MLKGRFTGVTHCVNGHELTSVNTYWSKRKETGERRRQCRACRRARDVERKKRMRLVKARGAG